MKDISMHILDIVQNSIVADAILIEIHMIIDPISEMLEVTVIDNGKGMSPELLERVENPFTTTRTTRKVGLGIPLFKAGAERSGGTFSLQSEVGKGTKITATYDVNNVDRPPLGEIAPSIHMLITVNPDVDFVFLAKYGDSEFELDTRDVKKVLEGVPLDEPSISTWLLDNLNEGFEEVFEGII